jgi:hypothetical protein
VRAVAEGQAGVPHAVGHRAGRADRARIGADRAGVHVRRRHPDVDPRAGRDGDLAQSQVRGGLPGQVRHHRLEPQDLVQDGDPLLLVALGVGLAQCVVGEQVPGHHRDELAGGDHPGGRERDALAEDLAVAAALADQVGDQVVAALPAAGGDAGAYVAPVERGHRGAVAQPGEENPGIAHGTLGVLVEEPVQPLGHAAAAALGQAYDLARDRDREREGQLGEIGLAAAAQLVALLIGEPVHQRPVRGVDPARGEVFRGLPPVLAVLDAVAVQHRQPHPALHPGGLLDAEAGLPGLGAAQHRAGGGVVLHFPDTVGAGVRGTAGCHLAAPDLALGFERGLGGHAELLVRGGRGRHRFSSVSAEKSSMCTTHAERTPSLGRGPDYVIAQKTETPYTPSGSVTGWKNVVPPEEQLPLPPEVRPSAELPA